MKMDQLAGIPSWDWPSDADSQILAVLEDRQAPVADRFLAAELAGEVSVMNEEVAKGLLGILRSEEEPVVLRGRSAIAFGAALEEAEMEGFDDPEYTTLTEALFRQIQSALRDIYQDPAVPKEVRRMALEASIRAPEPWHAGAVRAAYHDGDPEWKRTAVFCMRFIQGFQEEIMDALEADDPTVLREGILAAGNWEISDAWPVVDHLVLVAGQEDELVPGDPDAGRGLLLAAVHAAAMIRPQEAYELLSELGSQLMDPVDGSIDDEELYGAVEDAMEMARLLGGEGDFLDDYDELDEDFYLDEDVFPESEDDFDDKPN